MNVVIDTNVLIQFILVDDGNPYQAALALFNDAESMCAVVVQ